MLVPCLRTDILQNVDPYPMHVLSRVFRAIPCSNHFHFKHETLQNELTGIPLLFRKAVKDIDSTLEAFFHVVFRTLDQVSVLRGRYSEVYAFKIKSTKHEIIVCFFNSTRSQHFLKIRFLKIRFLKIKILKIEF